MTLYRKNLDNSSSSLSFNEYDQVRVISYPNDTNSITVHYEYLYNLYNQSKLMISTINWNSDVKGQFQAVFFLQYSSIILGKSNVFEIMSAASPSQNNQPSLPVLVPNTVPSSPHAVPTSPEPIPPVPAIPTIVPPSPPLPSPPLPSPTKGPVPANRPPVSCLSGYNMVDVKNVGYIPMNQLKIGDMVRCGNSYSDHMQYCQVYSFGHYSHHIETEYMQLFVTQNDIIGTKGYIPQPPLEISSEHLVYIERFIDRNKIFNSRDHRNNTWMMEGGAIVPASEVVIGDIMSNNQTVFLIRRIHRQGVYAPLTESGDIIVNENHIRVSNYIQLIHPLRDDMTDQRKWLIRLVSSSRNQHRWGHIICSPHRLFCRYHIKLCQQYEAYTRDGYSMVAYGMIHVASIIIRINIWWMMLSTVMMITMALFISRRCPPSN
jgi:Hint module